MIIGSGVSRVMPDDYGDPALRGSSPPGLTLPVYDLPKEVITCEQAAAAKGIPLANELKTIILTTTSGLCAVNIPGDRKVSLRKVKRFLKAREAFVAPREYLREMGLSPGTVCAVLEPVWSLHQLVSSAVLALEFVSTNNKSSSHFFRFAPELLLRARAVQVGDFEQ